MTLIEIIDHILDLSSKQRWGTLDRFLAEYDLETASEFEIVALLRTSFAVRERLPRYEDTRDHGRAELSRRGLDPARLLRGLY